MTKNKRIYSEEFQHDAVRLALKSPSISKTAKELGIPPGTLHTWLRQLTKVDQDAKNQDTANLTQELHNLRKENARLREEKEILKKAAAYFARETK